MVMASIIAGCRSDSNTGLAINQPLCHTNRWPYNEQVRQNEKKRKKKKVNNDGFEKVII
jgi:hypothetical protein